jgi:hypothetical protein
MPGGTEPYPPDPDQEEQIKIIAAIIDEWFEDLDPDDVDDCAGNIQGALHDRRCSLIEDAADATKRMESTLWLIE